MADRAEKQQAQEIALIAEILKKHLGAVSADLKELQSALASANADIVSSLKNVSQIAQNFSAEQQKITTETTQAVGPLNEVTANLNETEQLVRKVGAESAAKILPQQPAPEIGRTGPT